MSVDADKHASNGYRPSFLDDPPTVEGPAPAEGHAAGPAPRTVTGRRKIAVVGFTNSAADAPYFDDEWEIWGMNSLWQVVREPLGTVKAWNVPDLVERGAFHAWVDGHDTDDQLPPEQRAWLAADRPFPRYTAVDVDGCERFPAQAVVDWAERSGLAVYFTSTVAWQMAWALMQLEDVPGAEVGMWGIDMAVQDEYCVAPWTRVLTADLNWVEASKVKVGDKVIAFDEHPGPQTDSPCAYRKWRCATVERSVELVRPCYRVYLADGTTIISSAEHRWLVFSENAYKWRRTDELVTKHHRNGRPSKLVKLLDVWEEDRSWEAGYLAAAFDGEGHLLQRNHRNGTAVALGFSQRENAMSRTVDAALAALGFSAGGQHTGDKPYGHVAKYMIAGGRAEIMRFLGQVRPRRLLDQFDPYNLGVLRRKDTVAVERIEFIGDHPVIGLGTSEGTFVAEGLASHNSQQRPCVEYWVGVANARGVPVRIPDTSDILSTEGIYGFGMGRPDRLMTKILQRRDETAGICRQTEQAIAQLEQQLAQARDQLMAHRGAHELAANLVRTRSHARTGGAVSATRQDA